jgi:hypothetical protein
MVSQSRNLWCKNRERAPLPASVRDFAALNSPERVRDVAILHIFINFYYFIKNKQHE